MPTGKVKWFDAKKGFGFLAADDGQEVFLPSSALPSGATTVKPGTRMEFGVAQGRRGAQALSVRILDRTPSVAKNVRKPADEMAVITEDLIKLLDEMSNGLHRAATPTQRTGRRSRPSCARWPTTWTSEAAAPLPSTDPEQPPAGPRRHPPEGDQQ